MEIDLFILTVDNVHIAGRRYIYDRVLNSPEVCLCHGIPSGKPPEPGDGGYPELAERICSEGYNVTIFNFRGTGESGGNLDTQGWTRDLRAVTDYLRGQAEGQDVALAGFSGGAAAAIYAAARDERVSAVIACACPAEFTLLTRTESPQQIVAHFRNIGAIRDADFPGSAEKWLEGFREIQPIDYIHRIAPRPLLLVHGNIDETVPVEHARLLYEKAGDPKYLEIIPGAGHRLRREERAVAAIIGFLRENLKA